VNKLGEVFVAPNKGGSVHSVFEPFGGVAHRLGGVGNLLFLFSLLFFNLCKLLLLL
jgi:hypothetical protein